MWYMLTVWELPHGPGGFHRDEPPQMIFGSNKLGGSWCEFPCLVEGFKPTAFASKEEAESLFASLVASNGWKVIARPKDEVDKELVEFVLADSRKGK